MRFTLILLCAAFASCASIQTDAKRRGVTVKLLEINVPFGVDLTGDGRQFTKKLDDDRLTDD
jgi:hypothetical protein